MKQVLTLEELQSVTHAFDNFVRIDDSEIPEYYKGIFPKKCRCGGEMIMTHDNTQLQCCNPCCWVKMAYRLAHFISYHGFKGFGEQACLSLFAACHEELEYFSFLSAFSLDERQLALGLNDHQREVFADIKYDLAHTSFHFSDAIASLGIPNVGSRSTLFDIVKSPVVLAKYVLEEKADELCTMAGIQALSTRFYLQIADIDILLLIRDVMPNIMNTPKGEVFVAITGRVSVGGVDYTRSEFIALCESIRDADGNQLYKLVETKAQEKLQYVVADAPSSSGKYQIGERLGILITADEFYNSLLSAVEQPSSATTENNKEEEASNG